MEKEKEKKSTASLRWAILRRALLSPPLRPPSHGSDNSREMGSKKISRKTSCGFNLLPRYPINAHLLEDFCISLENIDLAGPKDVYVRYNLLVANDPKLVMVQRTDDAVDLDDFAVSSRYDIDTTGLVCCWPSEEVLAYFCMKHSNIFRSKRVLELGSGYGLAGLAIAAGTCASEVVISDGNPQVVDYIQRNININAGTFGATKVSSMLLHWNQNQVNDTMDTFDIIVASDCTFFKEFHESLAHTVKSLLKYSEVSEAIFLSPKRGNSLDKFLEVVKDIGLHYELAENYDNVVWSRHQRFLNAEDISWPNYDSEHCYPILLRITIFSRAQPCHIAQ